MIIFWQEKLCILFFSLKIIKIYKRFLIVFFCLKFAPFILLKMDDDKKMKKIEQLNDFN